MAIVSSNGATEDQAPRYYSTYYGLLYLLWPHRHRAPWLYLVLTMALLIMALLTMALLTIALLTMEQLLAAARKSEETGESLRWLRLVTPMHLQPQHHPYPYPYPSPTLLLPYSYPTPTLLLPYSYPHVNL